MVTTADFKKFLNGLLKPVTTKVGYVDARIKALLPSASDEIILYRDFQRLGKGLQREQLLDDVDNQRYIDVVEIIHNHLGWNQNAIKDFSDPCWQDVIAACSEEMPMPQTDWLKEYDREHRRAAAAKELRKFGVIIKIEDCDYVIENDVREVFKDVCSHRVLLSQRARSEQLSVGSVLDGILAGVMLPFNLNVKVNI